MRITILEFAPCADWIYHLRRDEEEGYLAGDERAVTIRSGAKLRPRPASIYAGGKATNVARVIDKLLNDDDAVEIELIVFRPDSPEGRYIHDLQTGALRRVRVRPVIIEGTSRLCVDLLDPDTPPEKRVAFNISPRAFWQQSSLDTALQFAAEISSDLLLMAGNPPLLEPDHQSIAQLYAEVISRVRQRVGVISLDTEKVALLEALQASAKPDVVKINAAEYGWEPESVWKDFRGTLVVTDANGCLVREGNQPQTKVRGAPIDKLFSTIGAGDAVHAGFTLARWLWGFDTIKAARYGQAVAAATVSAAEGTRGVTKEVVGKFFAELEEAEESLM